ncbi:hypothetical protein [Streptomyces sp. NPDC001933]|uniref:hypothetical protein n=1 Tax=Streptomyces sp. NPDC001933 TaxID=3364626 RepID=UPI0036AC2301
MSETIECLASRLNRTWLVHVLEHGVYGTGRTLKKTRENTQQGLALVGVTAEVTITPTSPELEALRAAENAYTAALNEAVAAMALRQTTLSDIAQATRVPIRQVKQLLAERAPDSPPPADSH